ncbi:hypothetical protein TNCV_1739221 [Trichonephila clavipes]|nr:hypothetical protein TNCV_1739221 [Trichonephila clavipes]
MVWERISVGGLTDIQVLHPGLMTALCNFNPYVCPYLLAMGPDAIFMNDSARIHTARIVSQFVGREILFRMGWSARSLELNPMEHL